MTCNSMFCECSRSLPLPHRAVGGSAVSDCGISCFYLLKCANLLDESFSNFGMSHWHFNFNTVIHLWFIMLCVKIFKRYS